MKIVIDPVNSERQWILFTNHLFFSGDGGKSFKELDSPLFLRDGKAGFKELAYDATHKVLYLCNAVAFPGGSALARSLDDGATWQLVPLGDYHRGIGSMGVTDSGTLVLGLNARIYVISFDKIGAELESDMVKLTLGDTAEEFAAGQRSVGFITCDGEDVFAFVGATASTNLCHGMGSLLSRDGGKTFQWITYNLPCVGWPCAVTIHDGKIVIGTRGLYAWKYK